MEEQRRSFGEVLFAQWPGALGFALIGLGIFWVWYVKTHGGFISFRLASSLIGIGIGLLFYWALANKSDGYNF
jgi:hypothetical protein